MWERKHMIRAGQGVKPLSVEGKRKKDLASSLTEGRGNSRLTIASGHRSRLGATRACSCSGSNPVHILPPSAGGMAQSPAR